MFLNRLNMHLFMYSFMFNIYGQFKVIFPPKSWKVFVKSELFLIPFGICCIWHEFKIITALVEYQLTIEKSPTETQMQSQVSLNNFLILY